MAPAPATTAPNDDGRAARCPPVATAWRFIRPGRPERDLSEVFLLLLVLLLVLLVAALVARLVDERLRGRDERLGLVHGRRRRADLARPVDDEDGRARARRGLEAVARIADRERELDLVLLGEALEG